MREHLLNSPNYKWYALTIIQLTTFLLGIDVTFINLALPTITSAFPVTLLDSHWILSMYFIVAAVSLPIAGKISDLFKRKPVIIIGCTLYALGAFLAFFSPSLNFLIAMRAIQGIGCAALLANTNAITMVLFPAHQRALALGLNGSSYSLGFALGFFIAGYLIDAFGWRSIFLVSALFVIATFISALFVLDEKKITTHHIKKQPFDYGGALLSILAIASFLVGFQRWVDGGHLDMSGLVLFAVSVVSISVYLLLEKRSPSPLLNLNLLKHRTIFFGLFNRLWMQSLIASCVIILPFFSQIILKLDAFHTGILLLTYGATLFVFAPIGGYLTRKIGVRILTCSGFLIMGIAFWLLSSLGDYGDLTQKTESIHLIVLSLVLMGVAASLFVFPNTTITMSATPAQHMGSIGGMMWVMVLFGNTFGTTFGATMLGKRLGQVKSLKELVSSQSNLSLSNIETFLNAQANTFLILALLCLIGIFLSWLNPAKENEQGSGIK